MLQKLPSLLALFLLLSGKAFSQGTITGKAMRYDTGEPLSGVNIVIQELQRGTASGPEGNYTISDLPIGTYTLVASFVGYQRYEQKVKIHSGKLTQNIELLSSILGMEEVIVTALGQEVSQRRVSFSSQAVSGDELNIAQSSNIKTGLAGKVAGVQILGQAGSKLGSLGDIRIRGAISLTDEMGEPLYVVDGVPVNNPNIVDMNNVEDVSVLKGPNATALYGQRGDNGVVIISTKSTSPSGVSIELNNSTTFERVAYLPNFQNQYGQGLEGESEWTTLNYDSGNYPAYLKPFDGEKYIYTGYVDESWGPEFDGSRYIPWYAMYPQSPYYGKTADWDAAPDNVKNFYETGITNKFGLALNYSSGQYTARLSYSNLNQSGVIPYSRMGKHFLNSSLSYDVNPDFNVKVRFNYTTQNIRGDVFNDSYGNQTSGALNSWFNRQLEMDKLRELKDLETPEGYLASWNNWGPAEMGKGGGYAKPAFWYNPYTWMDRYNINRQTDNLLVNVDLAYKINNYFELAGNANTTSETFSRRFELPNSLAYSAAPNLYNDWVNSFGVHRKKNQEYNFSSKLNYNNSLGSWTIKAFAGGQIRIQKYSSLRADMDPHNYENGGLIIPDVYSFGNSAERIIPIENNWNKKVLSLFAKATIGYKHFLYFDGTYRQDYSSALPADNNGYGYPSIGVSFIFSELIDSEVLSFGKLRAGWAQVGTDVAAERIDQTYELQHDPFTNPETNQPISLLSTSRTLVDPNIRPALNSSFEIGTDLQFFQDLIGLNVTYYNETRENEIIRASLSGGTSYTGYLTNAGSTKRQGIEISVFGNPINNSNFRWDATVNWSTNRTVVSSLPQGLSSYEVGATDYFGFVSLTHRLHKEWGQIRGTGIKRTDNGIPVINSETGVYAVEQNKYFGSVLPDWTGGVLNTFSYKNFSLTANIDFQKGGNFFSLSEQWGQSSGLFDETAGLNDKGNPKRDPVSEGGGVHITGVDENGNNVDKYVAAKKYYKQWSENNIAEPFINSGTYVKLRAINLSYTLPKQWFGNRLNSVTVALIARNLAMIYLENDNNWDPSELAETFGEEAQLPGTRSYGINIKVTL